MTLRLRYTDTAAAELRAAADWIASGRPRQRSAGSTASSSFSRRCGAIPSLTDSPRRALVDAVVRQVIYRTASRRANRALFTVVGDTVVILGIRSPGQRLLSRREVGDRLGE